MDIEKRMDLIRQVGEEIITEEELRELLETKTHPIAYDGFEPSGNIHIAQAVLRAININKMTKAGCRFKMWVADWFAWMNNKMGGDLEKIKISGGVKMSTIVANKVAKEIPGENLPNPKYGSRDFADGINQFRMVDNFLKSYFANDNWLVARNRNFAGFNGNSSLDFSLQGMQEPPQSMPVSS